MRRRAGSCRPPPACPRAATLASLPADLARETEALARAEGKSLSAVSQDALRRARIERQLHALRGIQGYWSRKARDQGILTERDLERYLSE